MAEPEIQEYICEMIPIHGGRYLGHVRHKERVIRCRDCAHASPCPLADSEKLMCEFFDERFVGPDDFCSWAKEEKQLWTRH